MKKRTHATKKVPATRRHSDLLDHPEVRSWRAVVHACSVITAHLEPPLLQDGCSLSRFQILFMLYFKGPLKPVDIAKQMLVTRGNMTMFLRRMQKDGLVEQEATPERSWPLYRLTPAGEALFRKVFPEHIKRVRAMMPVLDKASLVKLESLAQRHQVDGSAVKRKKRT